MFKKIGGLRLKWVTVKIILLLYFEGGKTMNFILSCKFYLLTLIPFFSFQGNKLSDERKVVQQHG